MEVVSEEISADVPTMTIVDAEEGAFGPLSTAELLRFGLHDVQDDRYSIFIIVTHDALVGIGAVGCHDAVSFRRVFGGLIVWH